LPSDTTPGSERHVASKRAHLPACSRRALTRYIVIVALALSGCVSRGAPHSDLQGQSIEDLQAALESGETSSEKLVKAYLARIEALDRAGPQLGAIIAINPNALAQLIEFNSHEPRELRWFGQESFTKADATEGLERAGYLQALDTSKQSAGADGIDKMLREHRLDLLVAATTGTAWRLDVINGDQFPGSFSTLPAVAGYPYLTVPMGHVQRLPLGISFIGPAWSEQRVLAAGYAFEQHAKVKLKASFLPSIEGDLAAR
jgi:Asp-tRNA(Asn)/Glu-tRNA(Gln) amidotransferase A subunit family amidase